ncbi:MAG: hypothetical protein BGO41_14455 [Clostridiales bacterium 38-18]|mgnify:CR=1 FL=1|nr:MAG: hypothetical protein BGO41_14455 [Clostridiales bacterium 38-18]
MKRIYLDYAATTPVKQEVVEAMLPYFQEVPERSQIEKIESHFLKVLNAPKGRVFFNGGGTTSDCDFILQAAYFQRLRGYGQKIIASTIEHAAIYKTLERLASEGFDVQLVPVKCNGVLDMAEFDAIYTPDTALVTVMMMNNEIGTRQPIEQISERLMDHPTLFHVDAVQALGSTKIDLGLLGVDAASFSAHKIYAPKGIGALYVKDPWWYDAILSSGCINLPYLIGFEKALELSTERLALSCKHRRALKLKLIEGLEALEIGLKVLGDPLSLDAHPGILNVYFPMIDGDSLVINYDFKGIAISSGSACSSGALNASHVIKAIGLSEKDAKKCVRFSIGDLTTEADIEYVIEQTKVMLKG